MKKIFFFTLLIALFVLTGTADLVAQCPMCKMSAESNMRNGGTAGAGLNAGILYMLVAPYLIVGGIAFWWWRNRSKNQDSDLPGELLETGNPGSLN
jgi:hypothetical protein